MRHGTAVLTAAVRQDEDAPPPVSSAPEKRPPRVVEIVPKTAPENAQKNTAPRGGKSAVRVVANPEVESDFATTQKPTPRVVANDENPRGGKSAVRVVDEDDDDDDTAVFIRPNKNARPEIAPRKRDKGSVYIIRWRWQVYKNGEPVRTASGGYKRGSKYVCTVENAREAKRIKKRLT